MDTTQDISGYIYQNDQLNCSHRYLLPALVDIFSSLNLLGKHLRIFELGCGNGAVANELSKLGFDIIGVDPSEQRIVWANHSFPELNLYHGSAME